MLLAPKNQNSISRQASVCHLASATTSSNEQEAKLKKKANRSKRCKSLLLLSSPFTGSSSSVKNSLLSLWYPSSQTISRQFESTDKLEQSFDDTNNKSLSSNGSGTSSQQNQQTPQQTSTTNSNSSSGSSNKCVKMKLFEQPLDKLFSPKAMKQLNQVINSLDSTAQDSSSSPSSSTQHFLSKRKRTSSSYLTSNPSYLLRKFTATNLTATSAGSDANNNNTTTTATKLTNEERQKLLLNCLPQPIRNLLNELYLRGPSTVGIFRKSPNAKHCKELRQKLESDSQSSIEQFQVTVIASVFKEWLRSLPDCLLMSRLYPQWIDVAKLIEPLHQQNQQALMSQQHQLQQQQQQSLDDSSCSDITMSFNGNATSEQLLNNSTSLLTDTTNSATQMLQQLMPLDRAHSCSTMVISSSSSSPTADESSSRDFHSINKMTRCDSSLQQVAAMDSSRAPNKHQQLMVESAHGDVNGFGQQKQQQMSAFALAERHSECLRIVCQLLEALNEANLILLRSFICVLWHIAERSDLNKMSANNLGVCVGQSLLNDEHHSSNASSNSGSKSSGSSSGGHQYSGGTFRKRHRRSRSQCLLSSTLSLTNATLLQNGCYLDSSGAQETAKYVPILVAFMIDNATSLFGRDVTEMFAPSGCRTNNPTKAEMVTEKEKTKITAATELNQDSGAQNLEDKENRLIHSATDSFDHIDSGASMDDSANEREIMMVNPLMSSSSGNSCSSSSSRQQILVTGSSYNSPSASSPSQLQQVSKEQRNLLNNSCNINDSLTMTTTATTTNSKLLINQSPQQNDEHDSATTTSILIVNPPKSRQVSSLQNNVQVGQQHQQTKEQQQERPLSATESTSSSSRASSSTSGVHSESPAFSNESDGHNTRTTTTNSPAPSSVSSPSSVSISASTSPVQEERPEDEDERLMQKHQQQRRQSTPSPHPRSSLASTGRNLRSPKGTKPVSRHLSLDQTTASSINQLNSITLDDSATAAARARWQQQHQNHRPLYHNSRYSTFMGVLNRVPKIPVQITTSNYGGEAVIYNPKPQRHLHRTTDEESSLTTTTNSDSISSLSPKESVISMNHQHQQQPSSLIVMESGINNNRNTAQQYHTMATLNQQELRQQRINEFLAHRSSSISNNSQQQQQQQQLVSTPSLPYLAQHNYATANSNNNRLHQQASFMQPQGYYATQVHQHQHINHQQQSPIFYSTSNLNSLQQHQQDRCQLYQRASLNPQRSHVMSLRNYYLSLQQKSQQQNSGSFRNTLHSFDQMLPLQQQQQQLIKSSHQQQQQRYVNHQQQQQFVNQQTAAAAFSSRQNQQVNNVANCQTSNLMMTHHPPNIIQRPQPRLAKIRQNQFNGIYVKNSNVTTNNNHHQSLINLTSSVAKNTAQGKHLVVPINTKPVSSSTSSDDHLSGSESDEYLSEWAESTMV